MPDGSKRFAQKSRRIESSVIRDLLKLTEQPEMISFAGGLPAPEAFPIERVCEASSNILARRPVQALQYGPTEGITPLREWLAADMSRRGANVLPEQVLVTTGSQQALDLTGKLFMDPQDRIVVENPSYLGALQAWRVFQVEFMPVQMDEGGACPDAFTEVIRQNPKLAYFLPNFQNPTGITMRHERREALATRAREHDVLLIEDDPRVASLYRNAPPESIQHPPRGSASP